MDSAWVCVLPLELSQLLPLLTSKENLCVCANSPLRLEGLLILRTGEEVGVLRGLGGLRSPQA